LAENIEELERFDNDEIDIAAIDAAVAAYELAKATGDVATTTTTTSTPGRVKPEPVEEVVEMPSEYRVLSYTRTSSTILFSGITSKRLTWL